jgi:hypothetical protein
MDTLHRVSFRLCTAAAIACALASAWFFVFAAYDTAIPAMAFLSVALALATVAAVVSRKNGGEDSG